MHAQKLAHRFAHVQREVLVSPLQLFALAALTNVPESLSTLPQPIRLSAQEAVQSMSSCPTAPQTGA